MPAAAAAAFVRCCCLLGGAAACSSADDPGRLESSCGWGWGRGRGRGRRYLSQSLANHDHNPQNKILPPIQIQKQKVPWLMLSSPAKPESRYFYDLLTRGAGGGQLQAQDGDDGMPLIALNREIDLPQIAGHHCVGSSQGFLITVDRNAEMHATNPITGAHLPLPSTTTFPNMMGVLRDPATGDIVYYVSSADTSESPEITPLVFEENAGRTSLLLSLRAGLDARFHHDRVETFVMDYMRQLYYSKVILSPSLDTAVAIHLATEGFGHRQRLAFARLGGDGTSSSWTNMPSSEYYFNDIIFHKGQLHAVDTWGTLSVYDMENPSAQLFRSPEGQTLVEEEETSLSGCLRRYVVESADGDDLFLVYWRLCDYEPPRHDYELPRTQYFKVFKLDKSNYKWIQVDSVGDLALFVGFNHTTSLSARDFHGLKPNCIYFTDDYHGYLDSPQLVGDTGVYNLKDGSIQFFQLTDGLQELNWPPPVWFMPAVC